MGGFAESINKLLKLTIIDPGRIQDDPVVDGDALQELKITGIPATMPWLNDGGLASPVMEFNSFLNQTYYIT